MIASGVVVYVSCQPVDFRKGAASLMAVVRDGGLDPFNGALYVFRSKRVAPLPWAHIALTGDYLWNEIDRPLERYRPIRTNRFNPNNFEFP